MKEVHHYDSGGEVTEEDAKKKYTLSKKKRKFGQNKAPKKRLLVKNFNISLRQDARLKAITKYFEMPSEAEMVRQAIDFLFLNRREIKKVQEAEVTRQLSEKNGEQNEVR